VASRQPVVSAQNVEALRRRLAQSPRITAFSSGKHDEAEALANAMADLADASRDYLELLPGLLDDRLTADQVVQELIGAMGVFAHMRYHLEESRFVRTLLPPLPPDRPS